MEYISAVCNSGRGGTKSEPSLAHSMSKKDKKKSVMKNASSSSTISDIPRNERVEHIKRIFLDSNPLLEAFGYVFVCTSCNNNILSEMLKL